MAAKNSITDVHPSPFFMEYPKISEDSTDWNCKELYKIKKWIVLEKVHGANVSFYISAAGTIRVAKRNSFLSSTEYFFGIHNTNIIREISQKSRKLYEHIRCLYSNILQISLHGELFGGTYVHT